MRCVGTQCTVLHILKVNNTVDCLMANKDCASAAASIGPGTGPLSNSFDKVSRSLIPQTFCQARLELVNMFKLAGAKRRKRLVSRRSLISCFLNFFVKPFLLENKIYLGLQSSFPLVCCSWVDNTKLLCSLFCCLGEEDEVPYEENNKP